MIRGIKFGLLGILLISLTGCVAAGRSCDWSGCTSTYQTFVYSDCADMIAEPKELVLSCPSDRVRLVKLKWMTWNSYTADATGVAEFKNCDEDCSTVDVVFKTNVVITLFRSRLSKSDREIWNLAQVNFENAPPYHSKREVWRLYDGVTFLKGAITTEKRDLQDAGIRIRNKKAN